MALLPIGRFKVYNTDVKAPDNTFNMKKLASLWTCYSTINLIGLNKYILNSKMICDWPI